MPPPRVCRTLQRYLTAASVPARRSRSQRAPSCRRPCCSTKYNTCATAQITYFDFRYAQGRRERHLTVHQKRDTTELCYVADKNVTARGSRSGGDRGAYPTFEEVPRPRELHRTRRDVIPVICARFGWLRRRSRLLVRQRREVSAMPRDGRRFGTANRQASTM